LNVQVAKNAATDIIFAPEKICFGAKCQRTPL